MSAILMIINDLSSNPNNILFSNKYIHNNKPSIYRNYYSNNSPLSSYTILILYILMNCFPNFPNLHQWNTSNILILCIFNPKPNNQHNINNYYNNVHNTYPIYFIFYN